MGKRTKITRKIKREVERDLYARAAGRCEFDDCNKFLLRSTITQEPVNIGEKAHIWSFSEDGPRGQGPLEADKNLLNDAENLILVCRECHKLIDADREGRRYSAELLKQYKHKHEYRAEFLTSIRNGKRSHAITFTAPLGEDLPRIDRSEVFDAMLPDWYPVHEQATDLSMTVADQDDTASYWITGERHLRQAFTRKILPLIEDNAPCHFSVFALAPQPLLILLGSLLSDIAAVETYQRHREPPTWRWSNRTVHNEFILRRPSSAERPPALLLSLSGRISHDRVTQALGERASVWEISVPEPHNDFLKAQNQLAAFREIARKTIVEIAAAHGCLKSLAVFPAMGVAPAVEFGRIRMPKADMPWAIYDENRKQEGFIKTLTIDSNHE